MDDGLISLPTEQEAISVAHDSIALCANAGLRLHKFMSNRRPVLEEIPEEARAQSLKTPRYTNGPPSIRAQPWCNLVR